jgi:hypothetical protein
MAGGAGGDRGALLTAILLAFVFAGVGLVVLGAFVIGGLLAAWAAFPFLLPVRVPLVIVWIVVAAASGAKTRRR